MQPIKRAAPDRSQRHRHASQFGFLSLKLWIGIRRYLFERYY